MGLPFRLHRRRHRRREVAVLTDLCTDRAPSAGARPLGRYRLFEIEDAVSTNDVAMTRLRAGDGGGFVVRADRQSGGRGRHGRAWSSPPGNLYASFGLLDPAEAAAAPQLGFVVGVALARVLRARVGDALRLKWPNDAVHAGAKIAGLLIEGTTLPCGRLACVVGIGVNCRSHPPHLLATDLAAAGDAAPDPRALLAELAASIDMQLAVWRRGADFAAVRGAWLSLAAGVGTEIEVRSQRSHRGVFRDIDAEGRLRLDTPGGLVAIEAGDVFLLRPEGRTALPAGLP